MNVTDRPHLPAPLIAAVSGLTSIRLLRLFGDWRAGLREAAIIVVSVLAALGAQAWWQAREERGREQAYLHQLLADARENQRRLDEGIAFDSISAVNARQTMQVLIGEATAPRPDTFVNWLSRGASSGDFMALNGTYRALVGTGDLRLIRNDTLRTKITQYYARLESELETLRDLRLLTLEQITPLARAVPFIGRVYAGAPNATAADLRRLQGDREVISVLFAFQVANSNRVATLRGLRRATRELRRTLEAELGVRDSTRS